MFRDRVYEVTNSSGTGNFTLAGAQTGFQSFTSAFGTNQAYYLAVNRAVPSEWEIGKFTVSGTTLARTAGNVLSGSSGAGTLVNFSAGTKDVYNIVPASALVSMDPTSILNTVRTPVYQDVQGNNCGGTVPNGNCLSNTKWAAPNANWWTWGLGLGYANPSGFDFAGGATTTNSPVSSINTSIFGSYSLYQNQVGHDVYQRSYWNCNCGATNCYTNCNCNCDCNCNCACCGACSCFPAGTKVHMADGQWKKIEDLQNGDVLKGLGGENNKVHGLWSPKLGAHRRLFEINGAFQTTADHLLWTKNGWGAISPLMYRLLRFEQVVYMAQTNTFVHAVIEPDKLIDLKNGVEMILADGPSKAIESIDLVEAAPETQLFCPILDGNQSFVIQGGYYADGILGQHIPADAITPERLEINEDMRLPSEPTPTLVP